MSIKLKELAKLAKEKVSVLKILGKMLLANQEVRLPDGYFHVSSLYECSRIHYWTDKDFKERENKLTTLMAFRVGKIEHIMIQDMLEEAGILLGREVELTNEDRKIKGSADAKILLDGTPRILEFKTTRSQVFRLLQEPLPAHKLQCLAYMWLAECYDPGVVLYLCKDTGKFKEYHIKYDQGIVDTMLEKFDRLKTNLERSVVPDEFIRCEVDTGYYYSSCPYLKECKQYEKNYKGERNLHVLNMSDELITFDELEI